MTPDERLLLEIDYSPYDTSCRDLYLSPEGEFLECRRDRFHNNDTHATRKGAGLITWPTD